MSGVILDSPRDIVVATDRNLGSHITTIDDTDHIIFEDERNLNIVHDNDRVSRVGERYTNNARIIEGNEVNNKRLVKLNISTLKCGVYSVSVETQIGITQKSFIIE